MRKIGRLSASAIDSSSRPSAAMAFLCLLLLLLLVTDDQAQGQQTTMTEYIYGACNGNTYTSNSTFAQNLNVIIGILTLKAAAGNPYFLTNATGSADNTTWVYGTYQCRGDLSAEDCNSCVKAAMGYYCTNGNAIGMRIQLGGCYYRFENYDFAVPDFTLFGTNYNCSAQKNGSAVYQADLEAALNSSAARAPANHGYAAATFGSAHALSQCLGYLSPSDCFSCLSQSSSRSSICNTSSSGFFFYVSCYYLFSVSSLLFPNSSSSLSSSSSPSPAPSNSPLLIPPPSVSPSSVVGPDLPPTMSVSSPIINITPSSTPDLPDPTSRSLSAVAIAGISVGSALAALAAAAVCCVGYALKRRRSVVPRDPEPMKGVRHSGPDFASPKNISGFTVKELQAATGNLHPRNRLGQGGFGVVYKGTLRSGREVAIKIISSGEDRVKGIDFINEAKLMTIVQHRNLIELLGWATDDSRWYLVYEYLPNGSLDRHLFANNDDHEARAVLDWKTRFHTIIAGIARGLCYLHEDSHVRIVHRDIKLSNILLGSNLEPKISDFGMARLFGEDVSYVTTRVAGTLGYMAPEYAMGGKLSEKVDVYSFGMVTLEIVSGRRVIEDDLLEQSRRHILEWAWEVYERKRVVEEMVDERIRGEAMEWEVVRAVHVALLCTQSTAQARPSMSQVYNMLRSQSAILDLPRRPPAPGTIFFPSHHHQQPPEAADTTVQGGGVGGIGLTYHNFSSTVSSSSGYADEARETVSRWHAYGLQEPISEIHAR